MRESGSAIIHYRLVRRINTLIRAATVVRGILIVSPDMKQIKPMPNLVGCGTVKIVRCCSCSDVAKSSAVCPPGNAPYPKRPSAKLATHILRYLSDGQGSAPPVATDFALSTVPWVKLVVLVKVHVIPFVAAQLGSRTASANSMRVSAATAAKAAGTLAASSFV